jgi:hypothetical protein
VGRRLFHYGGAGVGSIYCSFALTHASPQEVESSLDVALFCLRMSPGEFSLVRSILR